MSFYSISKKELTDIADAIRAKTGKSDSMTLEQMPTEIANITGALPANAKLCYLGKADTTSMTTIDAESSAVMAQ